MIDSSRESSEQEAVQTPEIDRERLVNSSCSRHITADHDAVAHNEYLLGAAVDQPAWSDDYYHSTSTYLVDDEINTNFNLPSSQATVIQDNFRAASHDHLNKETFPEFVDSNLLQTFGDDSLLNPDRHSDFVLFSEGDDVNEGDYVNEVPCTSVSNFSPSLGSWSTASPSSVAFSEDALGSPNSSFSAPKPGTREDVATLVQQRYREGDTGRRWRKESKAPKQKRSKNLTQNSGVKKKPKPKPGPKRPRTANKLCVWPECTAKFTRERDLEVHVGKAHVPAFSCEICNKGYRRRDNYNKHFTSKLHAKNVAKKQAASPPALTPDLLPGASPSVSSSTSLPSPYIDIPSPYHFQPSSGPPFVGNHYSSTDFHLPLQKDPQILTFQTNPGAFQDDMMEIFMEISAFQHPDI